MSYPYPYHNIVVIINSNEDLEKHIECNGNNDYPAIDFSTHTLLFAHGIASSLVIVSICSNLQQLSKQNYQMNVDLSLGYATVITNYVFGSMFLPIYCCSKQC